ncbi:MAG: hypothetical protein ACR2OO_08515 [Thermomicrobiales bacterium]
MIVFPAFSALVSLVCAAAIVRDALRRPRPDKIAWIIAFALFAVAAGAEVAGSLLGWTAALARVYYLTGAVLVVGFLALGELYLLAPKRIAAVAPGAALLITALSATVVWNAKVDQGRLAGDGWEAIQRGPGLVALAAGINGLGTVVIVGGLVHSAWRFKRQGVFRNRMIGCSLIAAGTVVVALGGTLTRFGHREYLYIPMAIGVAVIFAGYLWTRRPDSELDASDAESGLAIAVRPPTAVATGIEPPLAGVNGAAPNGMNGHHSGSGILPVHPAAEAGSSMPGAPLPPGVTFIETAFLPLPHAEIGELCRRWSVPHDPADALTRDDARRLWTLRLNLRPQSRPTLDALPIAIQRQLATLFAEVLMEKR